MCVYIRVFVRLCTCVVFVYVCACLPVRARVCVHLPYFCLFLVCFLGMSTIREIEEYAHHKINRPCYYSN